MVSAEYLDKIGFATIQREPGDTSDEAMDNLIVDYIEQARTDMIDKGANAGLVLDEADADVRGCIQSFVRWKMAYTNKDSASNLEEYRLQLDELRKNRK